MSSKSKCASIYTGSFKTDQLNDTACIGDHVSFIDVALESRRSDRDYQVHYKKEHDKILTPLLDEINELYSYVGDLWTKGWFLKSWASFWYRTRGMISELEPRRNFVLGTADKNSKTAEQAIDLLRKVILNDAEFANEIDGKTPNWDKDRIAELDMIILKMGITEFLKFSTIPVRVTINEYLEIAKEYSTPKSSLFINGILDNIVKEFTQAKKINKIGRGLR